MLKQSVSLLLALTALGATASATPGALHLGLHRTDAGQVFQVSNLPAASVAQLYVLDGSVADSPGFAKFRAATLLASTPARGGRARFEVPPGTALAGSTFAALARTRAGGAAAPISLSSSIQLNGFPWSAAGRQTGRLVVTEFMKDPAQVTDGNGEWIELWNPSPDPIDIEGWALADQGSDYAPLTNGGQGIVVPGWSFFVLGKNADPATNGGVSVDQEYGGFSLGNSDDEIMLMQPNGTSIDIVRYDNGVEWPDEAGQAIALDRRAFAGGFVNDDPAEWCHATTLIDPAQSSDTGTPGAANDRCGG